MNRFGPGAGERARHAVVPALVAGFVAAAVIVATNVLPTRDGEPAAAGEWRPPRDIAGVQQVYAFPDTGDACCQRQVEAVVTGPNSSVYISTDRSVPRAGSFESPTGDPHDLLLLLPDGTMQDLGNPTIDGTTSSHVIPAAVSGAELYGFDAQNSRIVRRDEAGRWSAVTRAQAGPPTHDGDGGPALAAGIQSFAGAAFGRDGALFVAERFSVRRVGPEGTITTVAGTNRNDPPNAGFWGGQGATPQGQRPATVSAQASPATSALLPPLTDFEVGPDGTLWLTSAYEIRTVGSDGVLRVVFAPGVGAASSTAALRGRRTVAVQYGVEDLPPSFLVGPTFGAQGSAAIGDLVEGRLLRVTSGKLTRFGGTGRLQPRGANQRDSQFGDGQATVRLDDFNFANGGDPAGRAMSISADDTLYFIDLDQLLAVTHVSGTSSK